MYYIISEEELRELYFDTDPDGRVPDKIIEREFAKFLQSKKPVELVAGGNLNQTADDWGYRAYVGDSNINFELEKYESKNIKIWIEG